MKVKLIEFIGAMTAIMIGAAISFDLVGIGGLITVMASVNVGGALVIWKEEEKKRLAIARRELLPQFCNGCGHHRDAHRPETGCMARGDRAVVRKGRVAYPICLCRWEGEQGVRDDS